MPTSLRLLSTAAIAAVVCFALPAVALGQGAETEIVPPGTVTESPTKVSVQVPIPKGDQPDSATGGETAASPAAPAAGPAASATSGGSDATIGRLPFTGIDLLTLTGFAMLITGLGFALRSVAAPRPPRF